MLTKKELREKEKEARRRLEESPLKLPKSEFTEEELEGLSEETLHLIEK